MAGAATVQASARATRSAALTGSEPHGGAEHHVAPRVIGELLVPAQVVAVAAVGGVQHAELEAHRAAAHLALGARARVENGVRTGGQAERSALARGLLLEGAEVRARGDVLAVE